MSDSNNLEFTTASATDLPVSDGEVFETLRVPRRQTVLSVLADHESDVPVEKLARLVAAREADTDVDEVTDDDVDETRVLLHHVDLPKLGDVGLLEYDRAERVVTPTVGLSALPGIEK